MVGYVDKYKEKLIYPRATVGYILWITHPKILVGPMLAEDKHRPVSLIDLVSLSPRFF